MTAGDAADHDGADLRCPGRMSKLLGKALRDGFFEVTCSNCVRAERAAGRPCDRVLHRFNLLGELVATDIIAP